MSCQNCKSDKIMSVGGKTSDRCNVEDHYTGAEGDGYVPEDIGIGGGDYIEFDVCRNCGTIQGGWPISDKKVKEAIGEM